MAKLMIPHHSTKLRDIVLGSRLYINHNFHGKRGIPSDAKKDDIYRFIGETMGPPAHIKVQKIMLPTMTYMGQSNTIIIHVTKDERAKYIRHTQFE